MLKKVVSVFVLGAMVMMIGCASVQTARDTNGLPLTLSKQNVVHVNGKSSGIYLLWIPLLTGNTDSPGFSLPKLMTDTASLDAVTTMATEEAKAQGAAAFTDMTSNCQSILLPFFPVLFFKSVQVSGNGVR